MNGSLSGGAAGGRGSLQKRFSDQRAKLLELEYHDPFTTESLCLVERLFADLVTTTESYEDLTQRVRCHSGCPILNHLHPCFDVADLTCRTTNHAAVERSVT